MSDLFTGIEHTAIAARDSEKLAEWYAEHLDFKLAASVENGPEKPKTCFVHLNGNFIEIMPCVKDLPNRDNTDRGLSHLAIVVSDFDRAVAKLDGAGIEKDGAERAGPWGSRIQFYRDPDGNLFHLLWRPKPL
ncbi:MAG: VOC family protein [Planctomycetota bacterium]